MKRFKQAFILIATFAISAIAPSLALSAESNPKARGKYLVTIADCNGCHTEGYAEAGGQMPEILHLTGSKIGFAGPWGVSYPSNLRITAANLTEQEWLARTKVGGLPPMPWAAVNAMTLEDQKAIYAYIRSLGLAGELMPAAKAPDQQVDTLFYILTPQTPHSAISANHKSAN